MKAMITWSLMLGLAACGGAPDTSAEDALGEVNAPLTSGSIPTPYQGDCTTSETLDKATLPNGNVVLRGTCTETCKKKGYQMGIYNLYIVLPGGSTSAMVDNLGAGPTRSAQVDTPYVPGRYSVVCVSEWKDKQDSTTFFGGSLPYTGGDF